MKPYIICVMTLAHRIEELQNLDQGWMNGQGAPIEREAFLLVPELAELLEETGIERIGLFPTIEGSLELEWQTGDNLRQGITLNKDTIRLSSLDADNDYREEEFANATPYQTIDAVKKFFAF